MPDAAHEKGGHVRDHHQGAHGLLHAGREDHLHVRRRPHHGAGLLQGDAVRGERRGSRQMAGADRPLPLVSVAISLFSYFFVILQRVFKAASRKVLASVLFHD